MFSDRPDMFINDDSPSTLESGFRIGTPSKILVVLRFTLLNSLTSITSWLSTGCCVSYVCKKRK